MKFPIDKIKVKTEIKHPDSIILQSLRQFGQQVPVLIDKDFCLLSGLHTYLAAKQLGWLKIEVEIVS